VCTLSWAPLPGGYALAMNRDERRTRAPGTAPARRILDGLAVLCPTDGEAGGTWISVNQRGLSLALLNRYEDTPHDAPDDPVSRGLLVMDLAAAGDPVEVETALRSRELGRYRPFTLACVAPLLAPRLFEWDGRALLVLELATPGLLRASSGADQAAAERERARLFRMAGDRPGGLTPERLAELHKSHLPERGALSVCMHREDAVTVSSTLITVTQESVALRMLEGSPCASTSLTELVMAGLGEPRG
jgi:hypothetical protein